MSQGPAEMVMGILLSQALGVVGASSGWRLGTGKLTITPDQQVCCYDSPGQPPNPKWLLDYPYVQVMVRGAKDGYQAAFQKMRDAYDVLLGIPPTAITDQGNIDAITGISTPSFIGNDTNERPIFSANFRLIFEPLASTLTNREPL